MSLFVIIALFMCKSSRILISMLYFFDKTSWKDPNFGLSLGTNSTHLEQFLTALAFYYNDIVFTQECFVITISKIACFHFQKVYLKQTIIANNIG